LKGAFQKNNEQEPLPNQDTPTNPMVFTFGRMNPPTIGHKAVVDKVEELAKENKAKSSIVLTHSQDPEKNPLTPEQKKKHAGRMFPNSNILTTDKSAPNIIAQVKKFEEAGHDHLILVVGSDRVDEMKKLLDSYNGKEFHFKKIDVVSAGERDPDSEDETQGMSATKMRSHAITNKRAEFQKGLPPNLHPEHADELFNDVKAGMDIKIDANTNAISLGRYAKRQDPIGVKARAEQQRRKIAKEAAKLAKKPAKPKAVAKAPTKPKAPMKPIKEHFLKSVISRYLNG